MKEKNLLSIYLIDDDSFSITMYKQYLHAEGYHNVNTFLNMQDCLASSARNKPDIVFIDTHVVSLIGNEALLDLKKNHPAMQVVQMPRQEKLQTVIEIFSQGPASPLLKEKADIQKMDKALKKLQEDIIAAIANFYPDQN